MWILLACLIAGAASYVQGSSYPLAGHMPAVPASSAESLAAHAEPSKPSEQAQAGTLMLTSHHLPGFIAGEAFQDEKPLERACCERRQAPRAEPVLLRTALVHSADQVQCGSPGCALTSPLMPPEPDLPSLTVVQLAVSRT